ncbi:MAG: hypothetical protein HYT88_03990 [Candidatus Omnitrophica bacterium]|nr:hypothetical protein [Candidatus Omnitrophota bacterium]
MGAAILVVTGSVLAAGSYPKKSATAVSSWIVYWKPKESSKNLEARLRFLQEIAVFACHFDEQNRIIAANPWVPEALQVVKARFQKPRPRVLVTFVNDVVSPSGNKRLKDPQCIHTILENQETRAAHIRELLENAAEVDGIELDYENLWAKDRQNFSRLIQELAEELHREGKWLSVVVQAKTDDRIRDGAGAMDWNAIAEFADQVKVMAYHYHYSSGNPGPVAPPSWLGQVTQFALTQIPQSKLCIVLTLHGFDWPEADPGQSIDYPAAMQLAQTHGASLQRDRASGVPYFHYETQGVRHEVWIDDPQSLSQKIKLLRRAGIQAIGLWHFATGLELIDAALEGVGLL